jgi:nucleotide-binding universal stress UspA family protein
MNPLEIQRILCPVDFSNESVDALACAGKLAAHFGAELLIVHAVEPLPYPVEFGPLPALFTDAEPVLLKRSREQLEALRQKELGSLTNARTVVEVGIAEHAICEVAKREKADLIVLSTHGRSGLSHLLLGSVAERVLRFAHCPVLTIKPKPR